MARLSSAPSASAVLPCLDRGVDLYDSMLRAIVGEALREAEASEADSVTISAGALRKLWEAYEARGEALEPFAMAADSLSHQQPDTAPARITVTCGDLRDARAARPR